jgi:hypothetical protein
MRSRGTLEIDAYMPMFTRLSDWQILACFSQLLEEIERFCGRGQQEVAKIVQCGEH